MSTHHLQPPGGGTIALETFQQAMTEASLIVHTPPDIPEDCEVVGICAVPEEYAGRSQYSWIVADFLAWKTIFFGVGGRTSQTWLSSLDIPKFLRAIGAYIGDEGDAWVTKVLGQKKDHITELPTDSQDCAESLFKYIGDRAQVADKQGTTLFIMIFAPVTPEHDICIDFGGPNVKKAFLTIDKIRTVIREAVHHEQLSTILVTPSPFTGGWACNPSLFPRSQGTLDNLIKVIAKSCGATYANRLIKSYTTRESPLLSSAQRLEVKYDDMMPLWPTKAQLTALYDFHRKIHETLEQRMCGLGAKHTFTFDPKADAWSEYAPRKGYSLATWTARWNTPEDLQTNTIDRFDFLGEAFGGTRASQVFHIMYLAYIELQTCPGDWQRAIPGITAQLFTDFLRNTTPDDDTVKRVFDAIEFRASSMTMAQILVKGLGLPVPDGVKCRYWMDKTSDDKLYNKLQLAFAEIHNHFDQIALLPGETRHDYKTVRFLRPSRWLAAAVAINFADASDSEITSFVQQKIVPLMRLIRATQNHLLSGNQSIRQLSAEWVRSLNLAFPPSVEVKGLETAGMKPTTHAAHVFVVSPPPPDAVVSKQLNKRKRVEFDDTNVRTEPGLNTQPPMKKPAQSPTVDPMSNMPKGIINERLKTNTHDMAEKVVGKVISTAVKDPSPKIAEKPLAKADEYLIEKPIAKVVEKPVAKTDEKSTGKTIDKLIAMPVEKPVMTQMATETVAKPLVEPATRSIHKSMVAPIEDSINKPLSEATNQFSKNRIEAPAEPTSAVVKESPSQPAETQLSALAGVTSSDLATLDMPTLLQSNPIFLAQVLAKAMEILRLENSGQEVTTGAKPNVAASSSAPVTVDSDQKNEAHTSVDAGEAPDAGNGVARHLVLPRPTPAEVSDGKLGPSTGGTNLRETGPLGETLISPTPPQTPVNARGISVSQVGVNPSQSSAGGQKLAGADDFWANVKW